ncbi:MAG: cysteine desulfurase NifS [bacterium]
MSKIYLDHNATTPVDPRVVKAMTPYFRRDFGNASSLHSFGRSARKAVEEAREKIAGFLGASPGEIVFTSGGTESDNFAVKGAAFANGVKGKHIITSAIEHPAVLGTCKFLEKRGYRVTYLPVDEYGVVSMDELKKYIGDETVLVTVMHANNEVGTIQPVKEIGEIAKRNNVLFHTDAVQAAGKIPINVDDLKIDLLSLSGHKLYGPKGIGVIYIRKGTKLESIIHGGHHEKNSRAGTENVAGIVGFAKAVEIAGKEMSEENERLKKLRDKFVSGIMNSIKDVKLNGHPDRRLPNTADLSFKYIEGESIVLKLDLKGVAASSGSACASGSLEPSHVLSAMGIPPEIAQGSVRFSLGRCNTEKDIDFVVKELQKIVNVLRKMSPIYPGDKKD